MTNNIVDEKIQALKENVEKIEKKVENVDKKTWLILIAMALLFAEKMPSVQGLFGTVLAFGK